VSRAIRALIVEDSPSDAKLVVRALLDAGLHVDFTRVEEAEAMREALAKGAWDVVLSDWSMPRFSALRALATLRDSGLDIPFVVVSGTIGEETAVEAMRAGAHDFVLKDSLTRLAPAIERELAEHEVRAARRRAEDALRRSEGRFARLAESGIVGIAFADLEGNVHDANDAYLRMLGLSRADLRTDRARWDVVTPPEWRALDAAAFRQLRETGVAPPWEKELLGKGGARVPVLVAAATLDATSCIALVADLSAQKEAEAALKRTEEQLQQAQKMEAIGRLAGGVAHDFNNLMTVIMGYTMIAKESLSDAEGLRTALAEVQRAAERATGLTRQLLAFSRRQVLQPRLVDVNEALAGMEKMLRRLIGEDVELTIVPRSRERTILVDPGQLEQVVMNLAVNARDAMPRGGKLTIETADVTLDERYAAEHVGSSPGRHVMLAMSDTGCGMDAATKARAFEPFFTTKPVGKGTGLGLSTIQGIVEQSGGSIWLYSEPGLGTTFKIYFPRADGNARPEPVAPSSSGSEPQGTETILLVEDDEPLRRLASLILRRAGYDVLEAGSGGDAILAAERHGPGIDLLLTDVVMPRMSGRELAERLRASDPSMRVLYASGYTDDAVVQHGVLERDVAFLQKPITAETLTRKVREVLDERRPG
jgi:two-component system, cell cycle sensor histidine kinase and response regulator CckA